MAQPQHIYDIPMINISSHPSQRVLSSSETVSLSLGQDGSRRCELDQDENNDDSQLGRRLIRQMTSASLANHHTLDVMEENNLSQKIDTLRRNQWMSLEEKRQKKAEFVYSDNLQAKQTIGILRIAKYSLSMSLGKFWETLKNVLYTFELWYSDLKLIEGNFGSGLSTYFKFLRWLFLLNFVMMIISCCFLVLPQILARFYVSLDKDSNETSYNTNPYQTNAEFSYDNLFTGEGFLTDTTLYYGYYTNQTIELVKGYTYSLQNAYILSLLACYLLFFVMVSYSMARSYRVSFIKTKGGQKNVTAMKVFCGWDFSIATEKAAAVHHKHVFNEIKEVLTEKKIEDEDNGFFSLFSHVLAHMAINVIFILMLMGTGYLMWDLLKRHSVYSSESASSYTMMMPIFITVVMNVFPKGFSWIVRYEGYQSPRTALYVTLMRTFLLNCVVVGVLLTFWLLNSDSECWQTSLGQEVYRLVITDFILSILIIELLHLSWCWISKTCFNSLSRPEFDIASNSLNLIYNQALLLVGLYFSPLLVMVVVLKLFITFYVKKTGIFLDAEASKSWKAAQTQTVFLILIFIIVLAVFLLLAYILIDVRPSSCGPFQGTENTYRIILDNLLQLENNTMFWKVVMFLVRPGVVAAVLVAMAVIAFILSAKAQAHSISANILHEMVLSEAKDKAFLFKYVKELEKANRRKESHVSSSSSFNHSPLPGKETGKRHSMESDHQASNSSANLLADSSTLQDHGSNNSSSQGSIRSRRKRSYATASQATLESEISEFDSSHFLY